MAQRWSREYATQKAAERLIVEGGEPGLAEEYLRDPPNLRDRSTQPISTTGS